jgi:hypothetical protein
MRRVGIFLLAAMVAVLLLGGDGGADGEQDDAHHPQRAGQTDVSERQCPQSLEEQHRAQVSTRQPS